MPGVVEVNARRYRWPDRPVVALCIDGSEPDYAESDGGGYIERAIEAGCMPFLARALETGTRRLAEAVVPTFTNPNNLSIVTGVAPRVHGICGNFFYERESGAEVMMNEPRFLRAETLFAAFERAGATIAIVTAKDKLRRLLGEGLRYGEDRSVCFSAERADEANASEHGVDDALALAGRALPAVYSAALSEFVLAAGVALMEARRPDLMYLSTTDYVQHKHAPGSAAANAFYAMMDRYLARLDAMEVTLALTADHGMKAKHDARGHPNVVYVQSLLDEWLGAGRARVICPITDPYVVHHGALGGFVTAYLPPEASAAGIADRLCEVEGIERVLPRAEGCARFELPEDRVGDLLVTASRATVLGTTPERHDLSGLDAPLRSHGSLWEQRVPFLLNRPTPGLAPERALRNYDLFDAALNCV